jgi:hypothetical protein
MRRSGGNSPGFGFRQSYALVVLAERACARLVGQAEPVASQRVITRSSVAAGAPNSSVSRELGFHHGRRRETARRPRIACKARHRGSPIELRRLRRSVRMTEGQELRPMSATRRRWRSAARHRPPGHGRRSICARRVRSEYWMTFPPCPPSPPTARASRGRPAPRSLRATSATASGSPGSSGEPRADSGGRNETARPWSLVSDPLLTELRK